MLDAEQTPPRICLPYFTDHMIYKKKTLDKNRWRENIVKKWETLVIFHSATTLYTLYWCTFHMYDASQMYLQHSSVVSLYKWYRFAKYWQMCFYYSYNLNTSESNHNVNSKLNKQCWKLFIQYEHAPDKHDVHHIYANKVDDKTYIQRVRTTNTISFLSTVVLNVSKVLLFRNMDNITIYT